MKKIAMISMVAAVLLFTGCSQKSPDSVDAVDGTTRATSADSKVSGISGVEGNGASNAVDGGASAVAAKIAKIEEVAKVIYFDFDKYNIRADQKDRVEADADLFNAAEAKEFSIKIEGNCDEWGTDEYNYALGLKRAKTVKSSLTALGVNENRMMIVSYGESNPVCEEHVKSCWDKNRRAEFKLLP